MRALAAALIGLSACAPAPSPAPPPLSPALAALSPSALGRPSVIAHRGGSALGPEETLMSLAAAAPFADMLELDVHLSADGVPVCLHDDTLKRTTGVDAAVGERSAAELQALDAGFGGPWAGQGARIPRLDEAIRAFPDHPFLLELKGDDPALADAALEVLRAAGALDRVVFASFQAEALARARAAPEGPASSLSTGEVLTWLRADAEDAAAGYQAPGRFLHVPPDALGLDLLRDDRLARAAATGLLVQVWTIKEPAAARDARDRGAHGLIGPDPRMLREIADGR